MKSALSRIAAATVVGGVIAYLITWLVPRFLGFESYAEFSVFWGLLFFLVSALSGIQQEITRATRVRLPDEERSASSAIALGAAVAAGVALICAVTGPLWADNLFPGFGIALVWPIAVGAGSYAMLAVVGGTLYGIAAWNMLFWLISGEAVLRLALVSAALFAGADTVVVAWAVAVPFPLTVLLLSPSLRRRIRRHATMDSGYSTVIGNVLRTIAAAASMGVIISGMPFVLGATSGGVDTELFGLVVITMTLTRAPLIVVVMALQSYFIVLFKTASAPFALLLRLGGAVLAGGVLLAAAGLASGPWAFELLFPGEASPSSMLIAQFIVSSALVAVMCLTGPLVLTRGAHWVYSGGWAAAAIVTIGLLLVPIGFVDRLLLALYVGPAVGIAIHVGYLLARGFAGQVDTARARS